MSSLDGHWSCVSFSNLIYRSNCCTSGCHVCWSDLNIAEIFLKSCSCPSSVSPFSEAIGRKDIKGFRRQLPFMVPQNDRVFHDDYCAVKVIALLFANIFSFVHQSSLWFFFESLKHDKKG